MNPLADIAFTLPGTSELLSAGLALLIVIGGWLVASVIAKRAGPPAARAWARRAGTHDSGLAERMCDVVRRGTATLIFAIALAAVRWPPLSALILGLGIGLSAALLVREIMRGLNMPRWAALTLAAAVFVASVARSLGGLEPVLDTLDAVGFTAGRRRVSLLGILQIAIALIVLFAAVRLVGRVANHQLERASRLDPTQRLLGQKLISIGLLTVAFLIGIDIVGIDLTALAVFSGAFGLAIGFGLQKTFGNLIAGIILLMDRSVKPGDVIVVGDSFGHVTKIGVRAVSIVTRDGKEHLIPNENLMTEEVENWSYSSPNVRIHIRVGVAYECDLELAQRLMIEAAMTPKRVLENPKPTVWLRAFGDSSVDHDILVWIADPEAGVGNVQSEILNRLWLLFKENGVALPYPQRDIHVKEWPAPLLQPSPSTNSSER